VRAPAGPSTAEVDQATGDVGRDMEALLANSQLKDIEAELEGWSRAIRSIVNDGLSAASYALDPRARDRALVRAGSWATTRGWRAWSGQ
jgi:hypothetical protein